MKAPKKILRREAGIALLTTILLMLLMSSLLIGFILLITQGQKMSGMNNDYSRAFYASEAGMEKITADLGTLFNKNYAPTAAQLAAISAQPPILSGIQYTKFDGTSGYELDYPGAPGTPLATVTTIKSGTSPYQDMTALATPYTLTVTARTDQGTEVKLQRTTQTVGIPMYQFGVFCDNDCSFFPGPDFNFGGRTHTNGNLFLASGATLKMSQKVTVSKDVVRTNLSNGYPTTTGQYGGIVDVTTSSGSTAYRALGYNEGSVVGMPKPLSAANPNWPTISQGYYNSNIVSGAKPLNLGIVTLGTGTKPIDIIRRPISGDVAVVTQQRFFAQASVRVLLSDNPADIMNMPCVNTTVQPFELRKLAQPASVLQVTSGDPQIVYLRGKLGANFVPLATSGAGAAYSPSSPAGPAGDGYWVAGGVATTPGFLKIEVQIGTSMQLTPCGTWQDVTLEVLGFGYVGKNINPVPGVANTSLPVLPGAQQLPPTCPEPFPNAIIRLERIRDNPGNGAGPACGVNALGNIVNQGGNDFWPNALFDTREGTIRDVSPAGSIGAAPTNIAYSQMVTPGGVMHYVELDAGNVAKWLAGTIPGSGHNSFDPVTAPNDYSVYISDRRGNWVNGPTLPGPWPPLSFSQNETGEYGFADFINSTVTSGCPDKGVETAEDLDAASGYLFTYGQDPGHALNPQQPPLYLGAGNTPWTGGYSPLLGVQNMGTVTSGAGANVFAPYPGCNITNNPSGATLWPWAYIIHANEARENPTFFFRRAVKIVNGSRLLTGPCPGTATGITLNCGLTIAAENPVYLQGDFNANSGGNGWNDPHVATSVVADAVTLLSNSWNDVNSFSSPFSTANRDAGDTWYRAAIVAGKGFSFPRPSYGGQDFGTDGGVHNFLRYVENWGGNTLHYEGSLISLFVNHQAIGVFKCCTTVYNPPTRDYNFDAEFLQPQLLPPRTPLFRAVNTTGFTQLLLPKQ